MLTSGYGEKTRGAGLIEGLGHDQWQPLNPTPYTLNP